MKLTIDLTNPSEVLQAQSILNGLDVTPAPAPAAAAAAPAAPAAAAAPAAPAPAPAPAPAAAAAPAAPAAPAPAPAPAPAAAPAAPAAGLDLSLADLNNALIAEYERRGSQDAIMDVFKEYGVTGATQLKPEDYQTVLDKVKAK